MIRSRKISLSILGLVATLSALAPKSFAQYYGQQPPPPPEQNSGAQMPMPGQMPAQAAQEGYGQQPVMQMQQPAVQQNAPSSFNATMPVQGQQMPGAQPSYQPYAQYQQYQPAQTQPLYNQIPGQVPQAQMSGQAQMPQQQMSPQQQMMPQQQMQAMPQQAAQTAQTGNAVPPGYVNIGMTNTLPPGQYTLTSPTNNQQLPIVVATDGQILVQNVQQQNQQQSKVQRLEGFLGTAAKYVYQQKQAGQSILPF